MSRSHPRAALYSFRELRFRLPWPAGVRNQGLSMQQAIVTLGYDIPLY